MNEKFREIYGDELADQVEKLRRKPSGVEVLKPKRPPAERLSEEQEHRETNWWDR